MSVDGPHDLAQLHLIGKLVAKARDAMLKEVRPGVSTAELDEVGRSVLEASGARSAPRLAYNFPGFTCISVNEELAHGIPSKTKILKDGDLVNIDVSAELDGYWADTGASAPVGRVDKRLKKLLEATKIAQEEGMNEARAGLPISGIGKAVEKRAQKHGFKVVKELCGHGVGRHIHEDPQIPNVFDPRQKMTLWEGLVLTIEPFFTLGATSVFQADDGWTLKTPDGSWGAQFEHTFVVTKGAPIVLTI